MLLVIEKQNRISLSLSFAIISVLFILQISIISYNLAQIANTLLQLIYFLLMITSELYKSELEYVKICVLFLLVLAFLILVISR